MLERDMRAVIVTAENDKACLFDLPASRRSDPETSAEAAAKLRRSGRWQGQKKLVYEALSQHPGLTSAELAVVMGVDRYVVARDYQIWNGSAWSKRPRPGPAMSLEADALYGLSVVMLGCFFRERVGLMEHSFNIEFAGKHGIVAAILYRHFQFWIAKNKANKINYHDDRTWTYNSVQAFSDQFPYLGRGQIRTALELLVDRGILLKGNYNKRGADRTSWYGFADEETALKGLPAHLLKSQMGNKAKKPICENNKSICENRKSICENRTALPDQSNPYPCTQVNNNNEVEKSPNDLLELDCRIKNQVVFLSRQLESIFHPRGRSQRTFSNIVRYFVASAQADPGKLTWFKEAAEWARVAKIDGKKAGGKALFVQVVKEKTGYGNNPQLLSGKFHQNTRARASPAD